MRRILPLLLLIATCLPLRADWVVEQKGVAVVASSLNAALKPQSDFIKEGSLEVGVLEGASAEGKQNASFSLYLSNGLGMYALGDFAFDVERYRQEPFQPSDRDLEFEPSRSELIFDLRRGHFGFWRTPARAVSDFVLKTPFATFRVESSALAVWVDETSVAVYLDNGVAYLEIPKTGFKETLQSGQYLLLKQEDLNKPYPPKIERATAVEKTPAAEWINRARWVYGRIRFEKNAQDALVPRIYLPKGHFLQRPVGDPNL